MAKIKIDKAMYERLQQLAGTQGYSSTDEYVLHVLERELSARESSDDDAQVEEQLRGLGYIE